MSRLTGGLIPLVRAGHERYGHGERTWWLEITWLRVLTRIEVTR